MPRRISKLLLRGLQIRLKVHPGGRAIARQACNCARAGLPCFPVRVSRMPTTPSSVAHVFVDAAAEAFDLAAIAWNSDHHMHHILWQATVRKTVKPPSRQTESVQRTLSKATRAHPQPIRWSTRVDQRNCHRRQDQADSVVKSAFAVVWHARRTAAQIRSGRRAPARRRFAAQHSPRCLPSPPPGNSNNAPCRHMHARADPYAQRPRAVSPVADSISTSSGNADGGMFAVQDFLIAGMATAVISPAP